MSLTTDQTIEKPPQQTDTQYRYVGVLIAFLCVVVRILVMWKTHSTTEDAFITLRYAENIAHGHGFVYNPGQHVLGTTTPLYTLILALFELLHVNALVAGKLLNIFAEGATTWLIADMLAKVGRPRAGWIAALLYATASTSVNICIGGMETGLVALFCTLAIWKCLTRYYYGMFVSLAILFLLRIDGLLLAVVLIVGVFIRDKRLPFKPIAFALVITLPWILFATFYFGSPIPVSMLAKLTVYNRLISGSLPNLSTFRTQFYAGPIQQVTLVLAIVGAVGMVRQSRVLLSSLAWLMIYYGAMLFSKVPAFGWYFLPPLPIYYVLVGIGIGTIVPEGIRIKLGYRATVLALIVLATPLLYHLKSVARDISKAQMLEDTVRRPIGEWLSHKFARRQRTVLLEPIGYIGYYSGMQIIDMVGLVSPETLRFYGPSYPNPLGSMIDKLEPEVLILRPDEIRRIQGYVCSNGSRLLGDKYELVQWEDVPDMKGEFSIYIARIRPTD